MKMTFAKKVVQGEKKQRIKMCEKPTGSFCACATQIHERAPKLT